MFLSRFFVSRFMRYGGFVPIVMALSACGASSIKQNKVNAQDIVYQSAHTAQRLLSNPDMSKLHETFKKAKAVMVFPSLLRAGFIVGGKGGSGVLIRRTGERWSAPAFYTLGGGSLGLQIGFEDAELMLLIMTDRGLDSILSQRVKLGADVSMTAGPVGIGASAAATPVLADIYSYSTSKGLYVGLSLEGDVISPRVDFNEAHYHSGLSAKEIIYTGTVKSSSILTRSLNTRIPKPSKVPTTNKIKEPNWQQ